MSDAECVPSRDVLMLTLGKTLRLYRGEDWISELTVETGVRIKDKSVPQTKRGSIAVQSTVYTESPGLRLQYAVR